jgi:hypothetical protein
VSSDSLVKGIIDDIINMAVKTAEGSALALSSTLFMFLLIFNEQRVPKFTFILVLTYYVKRIDLTQSCQIKQRYTFHLHPAFIE